MATTSGRTKTWGAKDRHDQNGSTVAQWRIRVAIFIIWTIFCRNIYKIYQKKKKNGSKIITIQANSSAEIFLGLIILLCKQQKSDHHAFFKLDRLLISEERILPRDVLKTTHFLVRHVNFFGRSALQEITVYHDFVDRPSKTSPGKTLKVMQLKWQEIWDHQSAAYLFPVRLGL